MCILEIIIRAYGIILMIAVIVAGIEYRYQIISKAIAALSRTYIRLLVLIDGSDVEMKDK